MADPGEAATQGDRGDAGRRRRRGAAAAAQSHDGHGVLVDYGCLCPVSRRVQHKFVWKLGFSCAWVEPQIVHELD